ncbi:hypothetical protein TRP8649_00111 [Pelagimonas phthalicica]|uniref:Prepilin-type N-terminal cleavage/methylation domain-containing protein n=1 Tax=Pelagimonas phthalicica TaxID=1037362 RepID=A0A238J615_9RHOB|nr:type II secretion system protein [Pelagimonas phthalicica]TDS95438.1 pilin/secretion family protein with methylation motif [Pelagimonas phthalicica]SMX26039.1 hypothetical protein TRP8649_00111 [Pelagimonas phthalicica]
MSGRGGYSLFEVLVAFAIMSLVLASLLPQQTDLLSRTQQVDQRFAATDAALSHLAEMGLKEPLEIGTRLVPHGDWQIEEVIQPLHISGHTGKTVQISLRVLSAHGKPLADVSELRVIE